MKFTYTEKKDTRSGFGAGLAELAEQAGDIVEGIGIVVEKSFQPGRGRLEEKGYNVQSLVRIAKFEDNGCVFID